MKADKRLARGSKDSAAVGPPPHKFVVHVSAFPSTYHLQVTSGHQQKYNN